MTAIVILALIALFIGLRLFSVLGERTGHEQPIIKPADPEPDPAARVPRDVARTAASTSLSQAIDSGDMAYVATAGPGVRALLAADPSFDVAHFLEGARAAYKLVLEAFWKGDRATLAAHCDPHVVSEFEQAIAAREAEGLTLDNRLVRIEQAVISHAELDHRVAHVTVRIDADIAAVTRDKTGEVVAGSLSDAVETRDCWTFRRSLDSQDPNWLLVETDEAE